MRRYIALSTVILFTIAFVRMALGQNGEAADEINGGGTVLTLENIITGLLTIALPWFMGIVRKGLGLKELGNGAGFLLAILFSICIAIIGKVLYIVLNQELFSLSFVATKQFWYEAASIVTISQLVFQTLKDRMPEAFGK